jgi:hypothetical protein
MSQSTNLNTNPYYDDFNEDKNYYKVLFKPGVTVQTRELNNLQSILQNQIEKFGNSFYTNGGIVVPGNFAYDGTFTCIEVESTYKGVSVESYYSNLIGISVKGNITGVTAKIEHVISSLESTRNSTTLYIKYQNSSSSDFNTTTFQNGEELSILSDVTIGTTLYNIGQNVCKVSSPASRSASSVGSSAKIESGVYFIRGYFVNISKDLVILDQYTNTPSYRIGLNVKESIVNYKDDDSLYDNAQGFSNYAAPGSDRFEIKLTLTKKLLDDFIDDDFVELFRVTNGIVKKIKQNDQFSGLNEILARRTFDESGNYYISPFNIEPLESLNNRLGNSGLYLDTQKTPNGTPPSENLAIVKVSPGKSYVKGYEVVTGTEVIDLIKPRTTKQVESSASNFYAGNLIRVNNIKNLPQIGLTSANSVVLYDGRLDSSKISTGNIIGNARIYDFKSYITSYENESSQSNIYLFDIQIYTTIVLNVAISGLALGNYIKGSYSNASGYVVSINSTTIKLYQVSGKFIKNEPLVVSGLSVESIVSSTTDYSLDDVKSINLQSFYADTVLSKQTLIEGPFKISSSGVLSRENGSSFTNSMKVNDIIRYSVGSISSPIFSKISVIDPTSSNITLVSVANVPNVCNGTVGISTTLQNISIIRPEIINLDDSSLYSKLNNNNISEISFLQSNIFVKKYYSGLSIAANSLTLPTLVNTNFVYTDFDEERYNLVDDSGNNIKLAISNFVISNGGKDAQFNNLSVASASQAKLITTQIKSNITSKYKKYQKSQSIIISKTKYNPSRHPSLTYGTVYGTRVEDDEISLNVADIVEVHGIFQSSTSSDPQLPTVTVSGVNVDSLILGEVFVGETSGSVAIYVQKNSSSSISLVYKSNSKFVQSEMINFTESKKTASILTVIEGEPNIVSDFDLDNGQRKHFYDFGRILRKNATKLPSAKLKIIFDYLKFESTDSGDLISANSYPINLYGNKVPTYGGIRNTDTIDIRPRVVDYTLTQISPFEYQSRNFNVGANNSAQILASNESFIFDYKFYLPRIDKLTLNSSGIFNLILGEPSESPVIPKISDEVLDVATVISSPYVFDVKKDIQIILTDNKRYTMSNLRDMEHRIVNLEYYTTLSLLETSTKNLLIEDSQGFNRFKCGFFVDNFSTYNTSNTRDPLFRADIKNNTLVPIKTKNQINLNLDATTNLKTTGNNITLDYTETIQQKQPFASRIVNVNPFNIVTWQGRLELNPNTDTWTVNVPEDQFIADVNRRGQVENTQVSTNIQYIRSRNIEFIGSRLKPTTRFDLIFDSRNLSNSSVDNYYAFPKLVQISNVVGTFVPGEIVNGIDNNGNAISFKICAPNHKTGSISNPTSTYNINPYQPNVGISTLYGPQSSILNVDTSSLQSTSDSLHYGNFTLGMSLCGKTSNATATVSNLNLVSDDNGILIGGIFIPNPETSSIKFKTGNTSVKLTTSQEALGIPGEVTSSAESLFTSSGSKIQTRTITYYDPLAQTFIVDESEGIIPTSIDIFFATKDSNIPVTIQIREAVNGYPGGPDKVIGDLEKTLYSSDVNISTESSIKTTFKFDNLTRLEGGREYAVVLLSDSNEYNVWISRIGEVEISSQNLSEAQKVIINKQPALGSLFKSQNGTTWVASPEDDLKFTLNKAKFSTLPGSAKFYNTNVETKSIENKLSKNSLFAISTSATSYNNGRHLLVFHPNHGMYSNNNKVSIIGATSDILPEKVTVSYGVTDTGPISVTSTSIFSNFEGSPVTPLNPGYIQISNEIIKYTDVNSGTNQLLDITRSEFATSSLNHPINSLVYKYEFNNVNLSNINNIHTVIAPSIDSYYIQLGVGKTFTQTKFGGGNEIYASKNKQFSELEIDPSFITNFNTTNVTAKVRTLTSTSVNGSEISFSDNGFENVGIDSITKFNSPRMVCSNANESELLSASEFVNKKSFTLELNLTSKSENISPIIQLNNKNITIESYRINQPINTNSYITDSRINSNTEDPNSFIYICKRIDLQQAATSLKVILSAYRSQYSDIRVLYKIYRDDTPDESQVWELFPGYMNLDVNGLIVDSNKNDGRSDVFVPSSLIDEYKEYIFTSNNLAQFTGFAIKIVGTSTNQAYYPVIQDLRVIALK